MVTYSKTDDDLTLEAKRTLESITHGVKHGVLSVLKVGAAKHADHPWNSVSWVTHAIHADDHLKEAMRIRRGRGAPTPAWLALHGSEVDEETGVSHLYHALVRLLMAISMEQRSRQSQDDTCQ